jgi:hypothetical protein
MNPNTIQITTTNPLVPRWRLDSSNPSETPAGFRDQWFQYSMNFLVTASVFAQGLFIALDKDADFILRQIEADAFQLGQPPGAGLGAYRLRDGFGNALSDDLILPTDVYGPIFTELWLPGGSRVFLDFDNTQNAFSTQVAIILRGCKRFAQ